MFFSSFKNNAEIFTPFPLLPSRFSLEHFRDLFSGTWIPYTQQYLNTLYIAVLQTAGALVVAVPAGFLFAKYHNIPLKILYFFALLPLLLPRQVLLLPLFSWLHKMGLLDTSWAVIFPGLASGLGVLYFTYAYKKFPNHLLDLARTEGVGEHHLFFHTLPLMAPQLLTYTLIHFILAWHEHLVPLVVLHSSENQTVSVGLASLGAGSLRISYGLLMAGSFLTVIPTLLLYLFLHKNFKSSLRSLVSQ